MPELAAHLERVAKELMELGNFIQDHQFERTQRGIPSCSCGWVARAMREGDSLSELSPELFHHDHVAEKLAQSKWLAAALAACAREAKLEEAKWWEHLVTDALPCPADCMYCARMAALERAVGEKASLDPQRGQHDS